MAIVILTVLLEYIDLFQQYKNKYLGGAVCPRPFTLHYLKCCNCIAISVYTYLNFLCQHFTLLNKIGALIPTAELDDSEYQLLDSYVSVYSGALALKFKLTVKLTISSSTVSFILRSLAICYLEFQTNLLLTLFLFSLAE